MIRRMLRLVACGIALALATNSALAESPPETPPADNTSTNGGLDSILPAEEPHGKALEA